MAETQIFDEQGARKTIDIYRNQGRLAALRQVRELFDDDDETDAVSVEWIRIQIDKLIKEESSERQRH